ncbi:MAG: class I SAM-dependent methyltransferase [Flavobacteriaceae bacterium]|jgi:2-polyprenyl-3-methyl-5-hydroxy-6-metoxy-1,4-benzoquinol methylase|nr:class I SAM-dependent methyltransferase [Flavobacteriaceae bacterium]
MINANKTFLSVTDYSVSKEKFDLLLDEELQMLQTIPVPSINDLPRYYESEDYISHTDGKKGIFEKVYQFVKKIAIRNKITLLGDVAAHKGKLLDIGCGTGEFLLAAKNSGWEVVGFEPNNKASQLAKTKNLFLVDSTNQIEKESLDAITMWHVLEHVPNLEEQIIELHRLLKPGGALIIAVPNFRSYDASYYGAHWAAYDVPRHLWHFSQHSIERLFTPFGFDLKEKFPMLFDSFYVSLLSEKYKTGKQNWWKGFTVGLKSNIEARKNMEYSSLIYFLQKQH